MVSSFNYDDEMMAGSKLSLRLRCCMCEASLIIAGDKGQCPRQKWSSHQNLESQSDHELLPHKLH